MMDKPDNSHALRKIKQRLVRAPFTRADAIAMSESEPQQVTLITSVDHRYLSLDDAGEDRFNEDCHIKGCACKR